MTKIVYVDMDDTLCDYQSHYNDVKIITGATYPQSTIGFFAELEPIDYALSCIAQLHDDPRYEVWIATAPSIKNKHCYSEKAQWIEEYLGEDFLNRMIIVPDKSKLIGDYLIDDIAEGRGQENFQGELIQIGNDKFTTWIDITAYLLSK